MVRPKGGHEDQLNSKGGGEARKPGAGVELMLSSMLTPSKLKHQAEREMASGEPLAGYLSRVLEGCISSI